MGEKKISLMPLFYKKTDLLISHTFYYTAKRVTFCHSVFISIIWT